MASSTTNLSLTKPASNENYSLDVWNQNFQKIDDFAGTVKGRHTTSQVDTMQKVLDYFDSYSIGMINVSQTVGQLLYNKNRQGLIVGFRIGNDYIIYFALDSNGDAYSGYYTRSTGTATFHGLQ